MCAEDQLNETWLQVWYLCNVLQCKFVVSLFIDTFNLTHFLPLLSDPNLMPSYRHLIACILTLLLNRLIDPCIFADAPDAAKWDSMQLEGWQLYISKQFDPATQPAIEQAVDLLRIQLKEVKKVVPSPALKELLKVSLYFSPEYPGFGPRAEYHPGAGWLKDQGRDPVVEKGIEFTNIEIFAEETQRMPNFALHELAHAFHDQVHHFDNPQIEAAYQRAKASGTYDRVQRQDSAGKLSWDKAYAITNASEYFAETSEAFFSRNDFFPFHREELKTHDPQMEQLLEKLWNLDSP